MKGHKRPDRVKPDRDLHSVFKRGSRDRAYKAPESGQPCLTPLSAQKEDTSSLLILSRVNI